MKVQSNKYKSQPLQTLNLQKQTEKMKIYSYNDVDDQKEQEHDEDDNSDQKENIQPMDENPIISSLKKSVQESSLQHPMMFYSGFQQQDSNSGHNQDQQQQFQYGSFQDPCIFEPRSNDFINQSLKIQFPQLPQNIAMMMMQNKVAFENMYKMHQLYEQQCQYENWQNFMSFQQQQQFQQQLQQQYQQQMQQQQDHQQQKLQQKQQEQQEEKQEQIQQQQQQQQPIISESQSNIQQQSESCSPEEIQYSNQSSQQSQQKKFLSKKIAKSQKQQQNSLERSKEQQKKDREETKNILRNTGNAIKNFHKDMECREIVEELLEQDQDMVNKYYGDFLPSKLEKFEDFQEIWNVDNVDDEIFILKTAFRKVCWIFMESYFFQYFFHKSRCQKESLRALVKFRHRFMEGIIDPECFHYFKKIGQK